MGLCQKAGSGADEARSKRWTCVANMPSISERRCPSSIDNGRAKDLGEVGMFCLWRRQPPSSAGCRLVIPTHKGASYGGRFSRTHSIRTPCAFQEMITNAISQLVLPLVQEGLRLGWHIEGKM